ncbi:MAG TPA: Ig-like domain-containing protein [Vicinamibacteria bacterium]|nr:Ig-like domain-containing protein [Vicinamibacteria bacterium]
MVRRLLPIVAVAILAGTARLVAAQAPYESQYGATIEVSIDDLIQMPEQYNNRNVKTHGQLEMVPTAARETYALRGTFGGMVVIVPTAEMGTYFEEQARRWLGKTVEVSGVFQGTAPNYYIAIWGFLGPPDEKAAPPPSETTLEDLLTKTGEFTGKVVKVRGQFRGQNLFGDLPSASRRHSSDWVIKEDLFAVWVTGKKPKGPGWELDAGLKRDSGKWILVTGRVHAEKGVVTVEATEVALTKEPGPRAPVEAALPPPPPPPRPKKTPVVVFSLPLDGDREVPANTVFKVQFNKDMDEPSFKGRVVLRYAGRPQPGDRNLDAVKVSYDLGLRTLAIDPGDLLRPGRVVEILLLPGIVDVDGLELQARPGARPGAATDVLRFQVAAAGLSGG